ncbi:hypothetical protein A8U91_02076 [Halomonas elongata]|uniref:CYTH domain protein n=1 Tax=Halomonas elongata TaxID=2746 RepID=A0A1B8P628_HALEL|nr:hypothetical protein [Halomonas elongata]OBX37698.1 hypothetical protein A8U91_02076 [Halomonas elongata]
MASEIELKLALGESGPDALRRHPRLAALPSRVSQLGNTYFDTPRAIWKPHAAPCACAAMASGCCRP